MLVRSVRSALFAVLALASLPAFGQATTATTTTTTTAATPPANPFTKAAAGGISPAAVAKITTAPTIPAPSGQPVPTHTGTNVYPSTALLTPDEMKDVQILALQGQVVSLQGQLASGQLNSQMQAKIAAIEAAHPGYKWHQGRGEHDPSGLVPSATDPATITK